MIYGSFTGSFTECRIWCDTGDRLLPVFIPFVQSVKNHHELIFSYVSPTSFHCFPALSHARKSKVKIISLLSLKRKKNGKIIVSIFHSFSWNEFDVFKIMEFIALFRLFSHQFHGVILMENSSFFNYFFSTWAAWNSFLFINVAPVVRFSNHS